MPRQTKKSGKIPFCSSRIYTNITFELFEKVNATSPNRARATTKSVMILTLSPPHSLLPGLPNDKDILYNEDTKLKSKDSNNLHNTFHRYLKIIYQGIQCNQHTFAQPGHISMFQYVSCMFLRFRYVCHMAIDSKNSVHCAVVVDLQKNSDKLAFFTCSEVY